MVAMLFVLNSNASEGPPVDARAHGAKGDGVTLDTTALQAGLDAAAREGRTFLLRQGTFLTGTLRLPSKTRLRIEASATLLGTQDDAQYPDLHPPSSNSQLKQCKKALLYAESAKDITIEGEGTVDGNATKHGWNGFTLPEGQRPMAFFSVGSERVTLQGVHVKNAAAWAVVNMEGEQILLKNLVIDTPLGVTHDGLDIVDCHHVLVERVTVNAGDDAICLKSGSSKGVLDVTIRDSHIQGSQFANGVKFGTASSGFFKDVTVENLKIENVKQAALAVESVDGGEVRNIRHRGIQLHNVGSAFFVILGQRAGAPGVGSIQGITFENVTGDTLGSQLGSVLTGTVLGKSRYALREITLKDVHLRCEGDSKPVPPSPKEYDGQYPDRRMWGPVPAAALYVRHADGVTLRDVTVDCTPADARPITHLEDVSR
jgi:polygalacturonase